MTQTTENDGGKIRAGDRVRVTIHDLAFGGEGVARVNDFVLFVPFTIPGETVQAEIVEVKRKFARGRVLNIEQPSAERTNPPCPHFGECGGCQYQHIDYPAQLEFKRKQVVDLFTRIGGFPATVVEPVVPCPQPYHYRNRVMVRSFWEKETDYMRIGFLRHDNRAVVDVKECAIASAEVNRELAALRKTRPAKGGLKFALREAPKNWEVGEGSFFQNNFLLLPKLVETVRDCLTRAGTRHLIDAYCGVGFFSLECADLLETFVGVESDRAAIKSARRNMNTRGFQNGEFVGGRAEDYLPGLLMRHPGEQTALILDPPRTGCPAQSMERVRKAGPQQVIYISCHPATLARDLKILCADGIYELVKVTPHDMFPQTQHVECVADLRRSSK